MKAIASDSKRHTYKEGSMNNWKLAIVWWNGKELSSRENDDIKMFKEDTTEPLESRSDCIECAFYWDGLRSPKGYQIWSLEAIAPNGKRHTIK